MLEGREVVQNERDKEEKKWDNCNSTVNKIYLKKENFPYALEKNAYSAALG